MVALVDFSKLDPETRACALVGYYLNKWAVMEGALDECIRKALNLDRGQGYVLARNISFMSKVFIFRTLMNEALGEKDRKKAYDKFAINIADLAKDRNMVAHSQFSADKTGDGVEFFVIAARSKLAFSEARWSINDTLQRVQDMVDATEKLGELETFFSSSSAMKAIAKSLEKTPQHFGGLGGLGGLRGWGGFGRSESNMEIALMGSLAGLLGNKTVHDDGEAEDLSGEK